MQGGMHAEILDFIDKMTTGGIHSIREVKEHMFLDGFEWKKLKSKQLMSPIDSDINVSFCSSSIASSRRSVRDIEDVIVSSMSI
jgi:hypothetical protein